MLREYDFSAGVRGKYHDRYSRGVRIAVTDSEAFSLQLVFRDAGAVDAAQLGEFLFLFRGAYAAALKALGRASRTAQITSAEVQIRISALLRRLDVKEIDSLFSKSLGIDALITQSISYHSPLEMILSGRLPALLAATAMAGGNLNPGGDHPGQRFDLPSIPDATKALRLSLVPGIRAPLGYGVRSKSVKLSRAELSELLRHDPATETRGGFQRFLIGLQSRVNRVTGDLQLSEPEMDIIVRYGRQPRRGGWQASIRKIFQRHFDLDAA